ncbi:MAG TPA: COX15/CtaA family protein, partial [Chryseosolibacter sp.]|nr:COX15/CtaA family protein [Chryseosolibacter sp.]
TGSGMGCPDWPKCFGRWVPPSSASELPPDYKKFYSSYREKKNIRFARYLRLIGLRETAEKLQKDKTVLAEADFNPAKTWVEYFNRVVGVVIGFMIFLVAVASWKFRKTNPVVTYLAVATLLLVGFQGWIGSFVVSSNLTPWTVTVHMFLALVIVAMLFYLVHLSESTKGTHSNPLGLWWLIACMGLLLTQILLGTRVRESVDVVAATLPREMWISGIGERFTIHRSFSWIVLILHVGLIFNLRKTDGLKSFPLTLILLILGTILTGAGMAWFAVPAFLQPVHLLLATVTFGMQFRLLLKLKGNVKHVLAD